MQFEVNEEDRQLLLLALGILALMRPGFNLALSELADKFHGKEMFDAFKDFNADIVKPVGSLLLQPPLDGNKKEKIDAEHNVP